MAVGDLADSDIDYLLSRFGIGAERVGPVDAIPGSFWGEPEAGAIGTRVILRDDTPVHSMLHEVCHIICMDKERRAALHRDAGSDDLEESAVCYLQILLADFLPGVGSERLMQDMDRWGYSFRLGSTARWYQEDSDDARRWLISHHIIDEAGRPAFRLRDR